MTAIMFAIMFTIVFSTGLALVIVARHKLKSRASFGNGR
jgi:hypothetical protein